MIFAGLAAVVAWSKKTFFRAKIDAEHVPFWAT
jgi:hypothetical protein